MHLFPRVKKAGGLPGRITNRGGGTLSYYCRITYKANWKANATKREWKPFYIFQLIGDFFLISLALESFSVIEHLLWKKFVIVSLKHKERTCVCLVFKYRKKYMSYLHVDLHWICAWKEKCHIYTYMYIE